MDCTWNSDEMLVTTKADAEEEEVYSKMEGASWFRDEIGMAGSGKGKKKNYINPTLLYDLDGDRSIKTLHERNDNRRKEGIEEEDNESMDSASDSDMSKSHQDTALGKAGSLQRGVSFAAGSTSELNPGRTDAAGSG